MIRLKKVFGPSNLRIFYSGFTSEFFPKIRKFEACIMAVFAGAVILGKNKFCSKLTDEHLKQQLKTVTTNLKTNIKKH
jgi:hypothetical protein